MVGIWMNWPGMWVEDGWGNPLSWTDEAAARAWGDDLGMDWTQVEIRPL